VDSDVSNCSCSISFIVITVTNWKNSITTILGV
jgi:hypothetical protein